MEEDDGQYAPMDLEGDSFEESGGQPLTQEQSDELKTNAMRTLVSWMLQWFDVKRVRDIDPWKGFICPSEYAKNVTCEFDFSTQFTLRELRSKPCPLLITSTTSKTKLMSTLPQQQGYGADGVYPYRVVVKRWKNRSGIDLGCKLVESVAPSSDVIEEVMANIPRAEPGTFMVIKNNTTQSSRDKVTQQTANGVALANRDFGVVNVKFLKAFGCIQERHLSNGVVEIPSEQAEEAQLPAVFRDMRSRITVIKLTTTAGPEQTPNKGLVFDRFFLVPCSSLIAWIYGGMNDVERASYGVYGLQIRVRNKNDNTTTAPYWIVDDPSYAYMLQHCHTRLISPVKTIKEKQLGIKVFPFEDASSWSNPLVYCDANPNMTEEQQDVLLDSKRSLTTRFYASYVTFPKGLASAPNLAPICPEDWYPPEKFKQKLQTHAVDSVGNTNQRMK